MRGSLFALGLASARLAHLAVETASPVLTVTGIALLAGVVPAPSLARGSLAPNGVLLLLGFTPRLEVPQTVWSRFANIAVYVIAAGFFVLEYVYRRARFPRQPHLRFVEFVRTLLAIAPSVIELESPAAPLDSHAGVPASCAALPASRAALPVARTETAE